MERRTRALERSAIVGTGGQAGIAALDAGVRGQSQEHDECGDQDVIEPSEPSGQSNRPEQYDQGECEAADRGTDATHDPDLQEVILHGVTGWWFAWIVG